MRISALILFLTGETYSSPCGPGTFSVGGECRKLCNNGNDCPASIICKEIPATRITVCGCDTNTQWEDKDGVCHQKCTKTAKSGPAGNCPKGQICKDNPHAKGYTCQTASPTKKCLAGWGDDADNCYPQDAVLTCSATGFTLNGLTKSIMYESADNLESGKTYGINANGQNVGNFDETTGAVSIDKKWNDIKDLTVTHESKQLKFEVEISADDPSITLPGDVKIHTTRTESFKITCSFSDSLEINIDPFDVKVGDELGTTGSVDKTGAKDVWANTFNLNVFSDKEYKTEITADKPIELGKPIYSQIEATDLPTALQFFVADCKVKASTDPAETKKATIFQNYECYNPVFGDAASIFMGRSLKAGATTEYKFTFPAFTFSSIEDDQLHMTCSITICPADTDCIESSYSNERKIDDGTCAAGDTGLKSNVAGGGDTPALTENRCCKTVTVTSSDRSWNDKCPAYRKMNGALAYGCSTNMGYQADETGKMNFIVFQKPNIIFTARVKNGQSIPEKEKGCFHGDHSDKIEFFYRNEYLTDIKLKCSEYADES